MFALAPQLKQSSKAHAQAALRISNAVEIHLIFYATLQKPFSVAQLDAEIPAACWP